MRSDTVVVVVLVIEYWELEFICNLVFEIWDLLVDWICWFELYKFRSYAGASSNISRIFSEICSMLKGFWINPDKSTELNLDLLSCSE